MRALSFEYKTFLCVIILGAGLTTIGGVRAVAQETDSSRELERVEVSPTERRPGNSSDLGGWFGIRFRSAFLFRRITFRPSRSHLRDGYGNPRTRLISFRGHRKT